MIAEERAKEQKTMLFYGKEEEDGMEMRKRRDCRNIRGSLSLSRRGSTVRAFLPDEEQA